MLLRIDDTDAARNVPGGEEEILARPRVARRRVGRRPGAPERARRTRYREAASAARRRASTASRSCARTARPTYQLASVVDDVDFGITHVIRGNDHRPNEALHRRLLRGARRDAARVRPPRAHPRRGRQEALEARRRRDRRVAARGRDPGARRCARTSRSWAFRQHDVHYDLPRIRRLAIEAIGAMSDEELAARVGAPVEVVAGAARRARPRRGARVRGSMLEPAAARRPFRRRRSRGSASSSSANGGSTRRTSCAS